MTFHQIPFKFLPYDENFLGGFHQCNQLYPHSQHWPSVRVQFLISLHTCCPKFSLCCAAMPSLQSLFSELASNIVLIVVRKCGK
jgi:hypothetical protein